jgi:hypothetical protein
MRGFVLGKGPASLVDGFCIQIMPHKCYHIYSVEVGRRAEIRGEYKYFTFYSWMKEKRKKFKNVCFTYSSGFKL